MALFLLRRESATPSTLPASHRQRLRIARRAFATAALVALLAVGAADAQTLKPSGIKRCINFGNALESPHEGDWGYVIQRADIRKARQAGFDTIRFPMAFSGWAAPTPPYKIDPTFLKRVDQVVSWALAEGFTVIVDLHHYGQFSLDPKGELPRLTGIWTNLAKHFRNAPSRLIFELVNEPSDKVPDGFMDQANRQIIAAIRKISPSRKIIYGNNDWNKWGKFTAMTPIKDPNVIATFHYYDPIEFTHQGVDFGSGPLPFPVKWGSAEDLAAMQSAFDAVTAWAAKGNQAVFLGEFGVIGTVPVVQRAAFYDATRRTAEAQGIGWCAWALHAEFDVMNGAGNWIPALRKALLAP